MSLSTNVTLTVNDYDIKLSRNLKFYENDQLKLIFTLNYWGIDNANGLSQRVLMPLNALTAILFVETPLGIDSIESATIEENVVTFYLTSNQTQHIGISRMQIQLSDPDGCQITLPPMNFEVRENIYDDEVILSQVLLADEDENIVVDENGNAINTGTQVSTQTYAVALSAEDETTATTSQPTKQIKDFNLKIGASGLEDLLIQDSDGATKRIKASEFLNVNVDLTLYYTKEEIDTLLNNKANISHTHTVADIEDMPDYALKTDIPTVPTKTSELTNDTGFITTIPTEYITESELNTELSTKANISDIPSLNGYATETYVQNKIAEASLSGGEVDLSSYATKDELATKADISSIPTKTSQLNNDSGFITSVPSEYITESELDAKGYLTEHQDITGKADKTELHTHDNKTVLDGITSTKVTEWNNKSNFDGNYNSLTNKPTIPTVDVDKSYVDTQLDTKANKSEVPSLDGYATETYVQNKIAEASLNGGEVDLLVNVKDYGVIGDGVTDDTEAIQNLINNIGINGGGIIYFPNGEYKFTKTLKITHSNITIKGETNSILKYHGRGQDIKFIHIYGKWQNKAYLENVILDGITLDCTNQEFKGGASEDDLSLTSPKPLGGVQNGIYMQYCYNSKIINCKLKDVYGNGIYINRSSFCTVDNCFLEDCSASRMGDMPYDYMGDGINANMSFAIMVSNNKVINRRIFKTHNNAGEMSLQFDVYGKQCARSGLQFEYPVDMDYKNNPEKWCPFATLRSNTEGYDLVFKNNYVYGYNKGIHLESGINVLIDGNTIINCNLGLIDATGGATQIINNEFDSNNVGKSPQGGYDWYYGSIVLPHFLGTTFNNPVINGNRFFGDADGICFGRSYIDIINNDFRNSGVYIRQRGDNLNSINITGNKFLTNGTLANGDTSKTKLQLHTLNNSKITNNTFLSENYYMVLIASLVKCIISDNLFKNARFNLFYSNDYNIFTNNICKETLMSKDTDNGDTFNIFPSNSSTISNNIFESTGWCCVAGGDHDLEIKDNRYFIGRLMNDYSLHLFRNRCKFINNEIIFNTNTSVYNLFHSNNISPKFDSYIVIKNNRIITLDKITKNFTWLTCWDPNNFQQIIVENNIPNIKSNHENKPTYGHYYSLNDIVDKNAYDGTYYKCIKQGWYSGDSWESGIVYGVKRPLKNNSNNVYICKKVPEDDSNNSIASTIEPTFTTNKDVTLDDGYVWYYLGECAEFKIYDVNNNEITQ